MRVHWFVYAPCDDVHGTGQSLFTCLTSMVIEQDPTGILPGGDCYTIATDPAVPTASVIACGADGSADIATGGYVTDTSGFSVPTGTGYYSE